MNWIEFLDRLDFNDDQFVHNQVNPISTIQLYVFVDDSKRLLSLDAKPAGTQFKG